MAAGCGAEAVSVAHIMDELCVTFRWLLLNLAARFFVWNIETRKPGGSIFGLDRFDIFYRFVDEFSNSIFSVKIIVKILTKMELSGWNSNI